MALLILLSYKEYLWTIRNTDGDENSYTLA